MFILDLEQPACKLFSLLIMTEHASQYFV